MKKLHSLLILIILTTSTIISQHSDRLFYGGYNGSSRINQMEKYTRLDCKNYLGVSLLSQPSDAKIFYHRLSDGSYYKGAVISDRGWDRVIVGVLKYNSDGSQISSGTHIWSVGSSGYGTTNFKGPAAVAVTYYANDQICLYIADRGNNRIQRCVFNIKYRSSKPLEFISFWSI